MEVGFQNRRRNYYIKKEFQRNFILKFCALVIIGAVVFGAIIYFASRTTVTTTFYNSRLTIKNTAEYILPTLLLGSAIVVALIGLATVFVTLFTSHRIAGPLYRIEKDVGDVADGNLGKKFNLRTGDELKALAVSLDVMAYSLRSKVNSIKDSVGELEAILKERGSRKEGEIIQEASRKTEEIKNSLDKFRT